MVVDFVQLFEGCTGEHFVVEFTLADGGKVLLAFACERADELMDAIRRSQAECARRRDGWRH